MKLYTFWILESSSGFVKFLLIFSFCGYFKVYHIVMNTSNIYLYFPRLLIKYF